MAKIKYLAMKVQKVDFFNVVNLNSNELFMTNCGDIFCSRGFVDESVFLQSPGRV